MKTRDTITRILAGSEHTPEVLDEVLPLVYDELKRLAFHFLESERRDHTLSATELVHETCVRLFGLERISFENRRHFFSTAAMAMRRVLVEHERRRRAGTRIPPEKLTPQRGESSMPTPDVDLLALDQALEKLETLSPRQARVIELSFFAGLSEHQIADVLAVSRPTIARDLRAAKLWLRREMRA